MTAAKIMFVSDMECHRKVTFSFFMLMLFVTSMWITSVAPVAAEVLVWEGLVHPHNGHPAVSTAPVILELGKRYRIAVEEMWWYDTSIPPEGLAADAQYYTTDPSDSWNWKNNFPAPGGASFLQINGMNINWGPFSNGDTGHTYSIYYFGQGAAIVFQIVDWIDGDYDNNDSHLPIKIYYEPPVGGVLTPVNRLAVLAPYLSLVGLGGALSVVFAVRRKRKA